MMASSMATAKTAAVDAVQRARRREDAPVCIFAANDTGKYFALGEVPEVLLGNGAADRNRYRNRSYICRTEKIRAGLIRFLDRIRLDR
jgi:hypothetical protein